MQFTLKTVHECMHMIRYNCGTQQGQNSSDSLPSYLQTFITAQIVCSRRRQGTADWNMLIKAR